MVQNVRYVRIYPKKFTNKNLQEIKEIQEDSLPDDGYDDDFWKYLILSSSAVYIAYRLSDSMKYDNPVGYIIDAIPVWDDGHFNDDYIIASFGVKQKYQNMGIGSGLFTRCLNILKEKIKNKDNKNSNRKIKLQIRQSNTRAKRFYERFGFKSTRILSNYYDDSDTSSTEDGYELIYHTQN